MNINLTLKTIVFIYIVFMSCNSKKAVKHTVLAKSKKTNILNIYCNENNDLYQLLLFDDFECNRYDDISMAIDNTTYGKTLLILGKNYPDEKTVLPTDFYQRAKEKRLKVYVEFPDRLPSGMTGGILNTEKERLVVTSDLLESELDEMDILDAGLFRYVKVPEKKSFVKGAKVAGFKKAVYGLDSTQNFPVLFQEDGILISTTKLSDFKKSRYSPHNTWRNVIYGIISILSMELDKKLIDWEPLVRPSFQEKSSLSNEDYRTAVNRGAQWYIKGRFLIHPDWETHWRYIDTLPLPVGPPMNLNLPSGDGSLGVMEGHYSYINPDGSQPYRYWLRADCVSETAMTMAIADNIIENKTKAYISENLLNFLFHSKAFKTPQSMNSNTSSYGLIGWADTHPNVYYGDDNARVIIGSILAAHLLKNKKWNRDIEKLILANFRTTGKNGFRTNALRSEKIDNLNWLTIYNRDIVNPAPHYESWLWATYLWLYDKTNYTPLLERTKKAISITMGKYPEKWKWTNGLQQERARMILPLAWLVRVENTEQHRKWLDRVCGDLLQYQVSCGALREILGQENQGKYGAPKDNSSYGTSEAPVIHENGDPVADMLYTSNFAFFALNEAAQATQNPKYLEAVDKLADFLVRIQSNSSGRADLDGCWFRAFDYENWEYYGSNADHGWGAWGTLTGWTQSFITTTLALKIQESSYWNVTQETSIGNEFEEVWAQMLPGVKK